MLKKFRYSLNIGVKQWKIVIIVYFLQTCLALTVGLQVFQVLKASIGNSLEIHKLIQNYDHTVIMDFLKIHGASISPLIGQLRWLILIYLIFAVFIDSGLLNCAYKSNQANVQTFWLGGATYFFPFLKVFLFFLSLASVWTLMVFIPVLTNLQNALESLPNEKYVVWGVIFFFMFYLLGIFFLFLWSVLSRFEIIKNGNSVFKALKNGWKTLQINKKYCWKTIGLFIFFQTVLIVLYGLVSSFADTNSAVLMLSMLFIQQIFAFFRIQLRQVLYISLCG